ncbi:LysE family translocator [Marinilabiliaceae bacterium JC017]|nr:LysE family translocator [Marinilabiliaceae bacterium JC017]
MHLHYITDGILIGISASVPLGPIGVLCIQRTLNKGRWSGFISGLGAAFSDTIYAIIAGFSLSFIVSFIEEQILWIQIIGAIILIGLGLKIFYTNPAIQLRKQRKRNSNLLQDFVSTFLLTITNPLAIFLFIAFFASFGVVKSEVSLLRQLVLILGVFTGASFWWFVLSSLVNLFRKKINLRRLWWINKIAGAAIVSLVVIAFIVWTIREYFMVG